MDTICIIIKKGGNRMYDNFIGQSKFRELKSLINDYIDYGQSKKYHGLSLDDIADKAYEYYLDGDISTSQYDYISSLIDDWTD